jgi:hypothetical protein
MEINFTKYDLMIQLEFKSLSSVYRLLRISLLPKKQFYSIEELQKLKISKALLDNGATSKEVQQYWEYYYSLKPIQEQ